MKLCLKVLSYMAVMTLLALVVGMVGLRLFGYTPYSVISGSMEPTYMTGSLVFVKNVPVSSIKTGDAISFVIDKNKNVATHRVVKISEDGKYFYTKGDANQSIDPSPVYFKNIIGKATFSVPIIGFLAFSGVSNILKLCCVLVLCILFAFSILKKVRKNKISINSTASSSGVC